MEKILIEVNHGVKAPENESKEDAAIRARLQAQVDEIRAKEGVVELPPEISGVEEPETQ